MLRRPIRILLVLLFSLTSLVKADDEPRPGYVGVYLIDAKEGDGATVTVVLPDSPAQKTGLLKDDVVIEIDGELAPSAEAVIKIISAHRPGTVARLRVRRGEQEKVFTVRLAERPDHAELLITDDPPRVFGGTVESNGGILIGSLTGPGNTICKSGGYTIKGSIAQAGLLEITLDGRPGVNGLRVDGDIALDGILHVVLNGITPKAGDKFKLVWGGKSLKGRFKRLILPQSPEGTGWEIVYDDIAAGRDLDGDGKHDVTLRFNPNGQ